MLQKVQYNFLIDQMFIFQNLHINAQMVVQNEEFVIHIMELAIVMYFKMENLAVKIVVILLLILLQSVQIIVVIMEFVYLIILVNVIKDIWSLIVVLNVRTPLDNVGSG